MTSIIRVTRTIGILLATLVLVLLGTAVPAAAASCSGYSCHGHDPSVYGCSATSTTTANAFDSDNAIVAVIQNRYSSGCNANWARGWLTSTGVARGYKIYVEIDTTDSKGSTESLCYPGPSNTGNLIEDCSGWPSGGAGGSTTPVFSDMSDGTNVTRAWVHVFSCPAGCTDVADNHISQ